MSLSSQQKQTPAKPAMYPLVIGLVAKRGRGKNTVSDITRDCLVNDFCFDRTKVRAVGFADPLRAFTACLCDIELKDLDVTKDTNHPTLKVLPRQIMQDVGDYTRRDLVYRLPSTRDALIRRVESIIEQHPSDGVVLITDVRTKREINAITKVGGFIWKINGPNHRLPRGPQEHDAYDRKRQHAADQHSTETDVNSLRAHFEIDNSQYRSNHVRYLYGGVMNALKSTMKSVSLNRAKRKPVPTNARDDNSVTASPTKKTKMQLEPMQS
jgi:hypothetical protein